MDYEDIMAMILNKNNQIKPKQEEVKSEIFGGSNTGENELQELEGDYFRQISDS